MTPGGEALAIIGAAVTPVVMLSAVALLITSVNNKHALLADRIRMLSADYRRNDLQEARRSNIQAQLQLFWRRFRYVSLAHQWLYIAVLCFIVVVLAIAASRLAPWWGQVALVLFIIGLLITLAALGSELLEVRLASRTLGLELEDIHLGGSAHPPDGRSPRALETATDGFGPHPPDRTAAKITGDPRST